jgi:hypothetical protein
MKYYLSFIIFLLNIIYIQAQDNTNAVDSFSHYPGISKEECPQEFLTYINNDSLKSKAVLLVLNEALHPLGRSEFFDDGAKVRLLNIPMRMNRCTLLYIDTGLHHFHTIYQRLKVPVYYEVGKIYMARLFSRKI